jgi:asparagine synthase (glutamine-hydrolysing)
MADSKYIYGSFSSDSPVEPFLKPGYKGDADQVNICATGYTKANRNGKCLFISEKIYNLPELRTQLNFMDGNSADLVLQLIDKHGIPGCRLLNGKFTLILCEKDKITIVRDRNGEGPVIYLTKDFFTDSYSRLHDFKDYSPQPDLTGITTFLKIGYIPAPVTALKGVGKVPAGAVLYVTSKGFEYGKLFDFGEILKTDRKAVPLQEAIDRYSDLLKSSLKRRFGKAGTVGVLLSGGYDSGGNIAIARAVHSGEIKTYSIGFKDNPASELPYAKMMADKFGADHHEYLMDGTEIEFLPEIIDALGDPFSESGFMLNYSVMKMVGSENLPVAIGGDGNDQYFGAGIRETALHYKMRSYGLKPLSTLIDRLSDNRLFDKDNLAFRIHYQNQKILKVMEPETFGFHDFQLKKMYHTGNIPPHGYESLFPGKFNSYEELFLQRNYYLHLQHSVNEVILFKASRMSEFFNVNLAFSYTDLDICNFLQQLPIGLRARGTVEECMKGKGVAKYIHKMLVKPLLPDAVTNRPKQGGFSPLEIFFNVGDRRKAIYDYIRNSAWASTLKKNSFLDDFFNQYEALAAGKSYWFWYKQVKSNQLINLLIIAIWWDRVIENKRYATLSDYLKG